MAKMTKDDWRKNQNVWTSETAREASLLGHQRKREKAERLRTAKEDLSILLNLALRKGELVDSMDLQHLAEVEGKNISVQTAIDVAMIQRAMMGDVQAATWVRDTVGDKPTDKIEIDQDLTMESWARKHKMKL